MFRLLNSLSVRTKSAKESITFLFSIGQRGCTNSQNWRGLQNAKKYRITLPSYDFFYSESLEEDSEVFLKSVFLYKGS